MNPPREPTSDGALLERLQDTLAALQRQHEQLDAAFAAWSGTEGAARFATAFTSADPTERNEAEVLHVNFERCHQLTMDLISNGGKLGERLDRLPKPAEGSDRLEVLRAERIVTANDETLLRDHTTIRNESQHAYIRTSADTIYGAALRQLTEGPALAVRLGAFVKELEDQLSADR